MPELRGADRHAESNGCHLVHTTRGLRRLGAKCILDELDGIVHVTTARVVVAADREVVEPIVLANDLHRRVPGRIPSDRADANRREARDQGFDAARLSPVVETASHRLGIIVHDRRQSSPALRPRIGIAAIVMGDLG